ENSTRGLLKSCKVRALCTTDDPVDDLSAHRSLASEPHLSTRVYPTFRPDKALLVHQPVAFTKWIEQLEETSNVSISSYADFLEALQVRHQDFHDLGGRLSDHSLDHCYADFCSEAEAARIFDQARRGKAASAEERAKYSANLMLFLGQLDAEKGWTKQLHLGALRNNNRHLFQQIGPDIGCDSMGDWLQGEGLSAYLGKLSELQSLPKMVLYNLNPSQNYLFATMAGNFMDGETPGKIQFGSGWWFLDQKEAMEWQINTLSNVGLLSRFIGMLTDSRSFLSFPRHEYFRRTLCNLLGTDVEKGILPAEDELLAPLIRGICFENARDFLGLRLGDEVPAP
ncbi:MAG: glucuronate isomerase, partial [Verrucomicrobiota bacterium]